MQSTKASKDGEKLDFPHLESLLRKSLGSELTLITYSVEKLLPFGENYGSLMLKLDATIKRTKNSPIEEYNFVAKTVIMSEFFEKIDCSTLMIKEIFMYTKLIPFYERIELENGINKEDTIVKLFPKVYGYRLSLNPLTDKSDKDAAILFENLKSQGYYIKDKKIGADMQHATKALKALAKFHALGIVAKNKYPNDFQDLISKLADTYDYQIIDDLSDIVLDVVKKDVRFDKYIPIIQKIFDRQKGGLKYNLRTHELWSTIIHNDFWTNNMMFHADKSGKVDNIKLVDFQTYVFADIFVDLSCFLCSSVDNDAIKNINELLDIYYKKLIILLQKFGVNVESYSREKFDSRFQEVARFDFVRCAIGLYFAVLDVDRVKDEKKVMTFLSSYNTNELFFEKMLLLLKVYEEKDWLH